MDKHTLKALTEKNNNKNTILERLRFNRRGASTPLWGVESCSIPRRWPTQSPAIPPYVVRTPHLHGAPTTEETSKEICFFYFSKKKQKWKKIKMKSMKAKSPSNGPGHRGPKIKCSHFKIVVLNKRLYRLFLHVLASARTTGKRQRNRKEDEKKRKNGKTKEKKQLEKQKKE